MTNIFNSIYEFLTRGREAETDPLRLLKNNDFTITNIVESTSEMGAYAVKAVRD